MSLIQQYCNIVGPLQMPSPPPPRPWRPICGDALICLCPTRFKKHAENITIYLQCRNRLSGKDTAVFGKQVLMLPKKKFKNTRSIIKSLLCSRPLASLLRNLFTKTWTSFTRKFHQDLMGRMQLFGGNKF